jgi:DNA polymerase-3 subunit gamma/tau
MRDNHREYIQQIIEETVGKSVSVEIRLLDENINFDEAFTDVEEYVKMGIDLEQE